MAVLEEDTKLKDPIHIEKHRLQYEISKLKSKTTDDLRDEIFEFMEIHDPKAYRKKMKGLHRNPFGMRDNYMRIKAGDIKYSYKSKLTAEQIRAKVTRMREQRLKA